jgi:hypothetical protein
VSRYYLASEYSSSYLRQLRNILGRYSSQQLSHPDLQLPRVKKDECGVKAFVDLMENSWIDPLSDDQTELVSLSTGIVAPPDVSRDLPKAHKVGEEAYQASKKDRLEKEPPLVNFHDKMKKQNLKTFAHIKRKHAANDKAQGKQVVLKADRNLFGHMILVAQSRQLHQRCSSSPPGTPTKATLAREQKVSPAAKAFPEPSAWHH